MVWTAFLLTLVESVCRTEVYTTACNELNKYSAVLFRSAECEEKLVKWVSIDCEFECGPGTFLEIVENGLVKCSQCPLGSFSLGGGVVYGSHDNPWSYAFETEVISDCWVNKNGTEVHNFLCEPWKPHKSTVKTSQAPLNLSSTTRLIFSTKLVKPGFFHMRYKKDTFQHNGLNIGALSLFINDLPILTDSKPSKTDWSIFKVPLNIGRFEVVIEYSVIPTDLHPDPRAHISTVEISGSQFADLQCTECAVGNGNSQCEICKEDHYFKDGACLSCPPDRYSFKGTNAAEGCIKRRECEGSDLKKVFSDCVNGVNSISYEWIQPFICMDTGKAKPGTENEVDCEGCLQGFFEVVDGNRSSCSACGQGTYYNESLAKCTICPPGYTVESFSNSSGFWEIPKGFSTYCLTSVGNTCSPDIGWFPFRGHLATQSFSQTQDFKHLTKKVNIVQTKGQVNVKYLINPGLAQILIYVDGQIYGKWANQELSLGVIQLSKGLHSIDWVYSSTSNSTELGQALIYYIEVWGSDEGIGIGCLKCDKGHISLNQSLYCVPCPAGHQSDETATSCIKCPKDFFSTGPGEECTKCPEGTFSNQNNTACLGKPFLTNKQRIYYIHSLSGIGNTEEQDNKGVCDMATASLYCHQTFYGPLEGEDKTFYLSVLNPSTLALPNIHHLYEERPGYSYAVVEKEKLTHKKVSIERSCWNDRVIVNLGSKVESVFLRDFGFSVKYTMGDVCGLYGKNFETEIEVRCNKSTGVGWPVFISRSNCTYSFSWMSKYGCPVCEFSKLKRIVGECKDGKRVIKKESNKDCVIQFGTKIEWTENCSDLGEFINSIPFLFVLSFFFILTVSGLASFIFYRKYKAIYQQLTLTTET